MRRTSQQPPLGAVLNKNHPLAQGLIGCWLANESGGFTLNNTVNTTQNGVLTSGAFFKTTQKGGAVFFDGTSDYINIPNITNLQPTTAVTFSFWVNFSAFAADYQAVAGMSLYGNSRGYLFDLDGTTQQIGFGIGNGTWAYPPNSSTLSTNTWYNVCGTWDGAVVTLYVNGVQSGTPAAKTSITYTGTVLDIGRYGTNSDHLFKGGSMTDFKLYNRALSATEVRQLYTNSYSMFLPPPQGFGTLISYIYTRNDEAALPSDDTDLSVIYTAQDVIDVSTEDSVYVDQDASGNFYAIHQFKNNIGTNNSCLLTWKGKTDTAPSSSTVHLEIYNRNTTTWDSVDTDSTTGANTDFTLTGTIPDLTDYKDGSNLISCRVYQQD